MRNTVFKLTGTLLLCLFVLAAFRAPVMSRSALATTDQIKQTNSLEGAWRLTGKNKPDGISTIKLVQDGYFTVAVYDEQNMKFIGTYGGTYSLANGQLTENYEFSTIEARQVGKTVTGKSTIKDGFWQTTGPGNKTAETWEKLNEQNNNPPLAGTWRITGRERDGEMSTMRPGPRKTLKVLSGTRFQWIAFNTETAEFSGTGGGTYTAENGKYTEHIEFFSRDSSRVGMQLSFNYEVKNDKWHHTGQSSTGSKVNEIWERITAK
jgi:hypothetical protein